MATFTVPAISLAQQAIRELTVARERFNRSTHNLTDAMSGFAPGEETMSTAQQVAHTARVIDWFMEGAFRSEGFDMDFEEQIKPAMAAGSLSAASWRSHSLRADAKHRTSRSLWAVMLLVNGRMVRSYQFSCV